MTGRQPDRLSGANRRMSIPRSALMSSAGRRIAVAAVTFLCLGLVSGQALGAPDREVDLSWAVKVPLRDGVKLNATVYKPKGLQKGLPVIFTMTPYISDTYH